MPLSENMKLLNSHFTAMACVHTGPDNFATPQGGGSEEKNKCIFAPKFPKFSPKNFRGGQSAFFDSQGGPLFSLREGTRVGHRG